MPRPQRTAPGGLLYHVLNRGNDRRTIFETSGDYLAFERILAEIALRVPMRVLAWCLMPNHWHLVLWPREDNDLSNYLRLVTLTHTQRWHANRGTAGTGHLYQGRFKSFVIQQDAHFLAVCRYVEGNALRAGLVRRAEAWPWSSLYRRLAETDGGFVGDEPWPVPRPRGWVELVNAALPASQTAAMQTCAQRGTPFGDPQWVDVKAGQLQLESTLRRRGRPSAGSVVSEKGPDPF